VEAGLSTRSFYRSFQSKDDLVLAMYRHNAEDAAERLAARAGAAGSPGHRLSAWIDEILSFAYDPRKAERMALLSSPGVRRAVGYLDEERNARRLFAAPLVEVLDAGRADGTFHTTDSGRDAHSVLAVVLEALAWSRVEDPRPTSSDALAHCLRFVHGALASA
jgi:AcrR family transcriptional regulator